MPLMQPSLVAHWWFPQVLLIGPWQRTILYYFPVYTTWKLRAAASSSSHTSRWPGQGSQWFWMEKWTLLFVWGSGGEEREEEKVEGVNFQFIGLTDVVISLQFVSISGTSFYKFTGNRLQQFFAWLIMVHTSSSCKLYTLCPEQFFHITFHRTVKNYLEFSFACFINIINIFCFQFSPIKVMTSSTFTAEYLIRESHIFIIPVKSLPVIESHAFPPSEQFHFSVYQ